MNTKNSRSLRSTPAVGFCLLVAGSLSLCAQPQTTKPEPEKSELRQFLERDYLLGDWGGRRTRWRDQYGIDFEFLYAASVPIALDGGLQSGAEYEGAGLMMLSVDTEKAGLWANGNFRISSLALHSGDDFSEKHVGDLNKVSLLDFPDTFRLWEMFYEHKFLDGKISVKAGQLDIGMDFLVPEYYNTIGSVNFLNQTFFFPTMAFNVYDQPFFPVGHHALASTPYAAPGARILGKVTPEIYVQAGVYDGDPDRDHGGTHMDLSSDEGALLYYEIGYRHNQGKDASGVQGNFKLGGWYHTDEFFDMYQGTFVAFDNFVAANGIPLPPISPGTASTHNGNWGVYFLIDHVLWWEKLEKDPAQQGLTGFFRASYAPPDRNLAQYGIDGGLVYKGLIPSRDWDCLGVAFSYLSISDDLRDAQRDINAIFGPFGPVLPKADYEAVLEMNYKVQATAWAAVDLSVQRVFHPGGRVAQEIPDAWVFIVQTTFRF
jgi:porin